MSSYHRAILCILSILGCIVAGVIVLSRPTRSWVDLEARCEELILPVATSSTIEATSVRFFQWEGKLENVGSLNGIGMGTRSATLGFSEPSEGTSSSPAAVVFSFNDERSLLRIKMPRLTKMSLDNSGTQQLLVFQLINGESAQLEFNASTMGVQTSNIKVSSNGRLPIPAAKFYVSSPKRSQIVGVFRSLRDPQHPETMSLKIATETSIHSDSTELVRLYERDLKAISDIQMSVCQANGSSLEGDALKLLGRSADIEIRLALGKQLSADLVFGSASLSTIRVRLRGFADSCPASAGNGESVRPLR